MAVGRRTLLHDVNPHLICPLCRGYFIDATTVVECLHSFCRSCILKHLSAAGHCPSCKYVLNQAKPNIKADKTLQDIVYKLVPGLYHREMLKRREFYKKHPEYAKSATPEQRGEDVSGRLIFNPEDVVSLSLEYLPPGADPLTILLSTNDMDTNNSHDANSSSNNNNNSNHNGNTASNRRYLRCPALVTIAHLKKFVAMKYSVDITRYTIEICHRRAPLPENWTLMDVAYKYAWKRIAPMRFFYRVAQEEQRLEAPLHQRPSTPGLGARDCLPPNDARDDSNIDDNLAKHSETSKSEVKSANDSIETIPLTKDLNKITNDKVSSPIDRKQITMAEKDEANKITITIASTTSPTTTVSATSPTMTVSVTSPTTTVFATSPTTTISATTSPTTTVSATSPTTTVSVTSPTTTVSVTSPTTTVSATSPTTTVSATSSTTTVSATSLITTVSAISPTTTVSATSPTTTMSITSSTLTATNMTMMLTTTSTNSSLSTVTTCNDSNKQKKSPIKILKNPDGRYEVLKNPPATANWNGKEQATATTDIKCPTSPEFSVVNSNGVKLTLKQCSPPQSSSAKKLKVISNVLLRCSQMEKDASSSSGTLMIQQLQQQQDKEKVTTTDSVTPDKQEKQRRKVTFVDRLPTSEKTSPSVTMPKTALKKPAEQQDKKQFLQGFQLTAREPSMSDDSKLKSSIRDIGIAASTTKPLQKNTAMVKMEEFSKKDNEIKKKSNTENADSNANNTATNMTAKRTGVMPVVGNMRGYANQTDDIDGRAFNSGTSPNSTNILSGNHATKMDVYTFSSDPPIVPAGAVKRKCPPGVPIVDLKRRKSAQIAQRQELNKKQNVSLHNPVVKLPRISNADIIPTNRAINMAGDGSGSSRVSNVNNVKASTGSSLSNDTRDFLVDGYGLNIPASLSITLTSPRSPGTSAQFVEPSDPIDNSRKAVLGKVNPTITLNNRSVDPRVLKALKTGQIRMPATASKTKTTAIATAKQATTTTTDRSETANHQRSTTLTGRRKREHESSRDILDLSGGNKKMDIHPLRIPQPVTKLNKGNKVTADRDNMQPGGISDQGQVVTLIGGHRYYRAPPGSLTPAVHRVNDCPPLPPSPSRTPVYAPSFSSVNRSSSDLSSVFPSLPSLYALHQAPNLQQFQMDAARLRLPPPRSTTEGGVTSLTGNGDNANSSISGMSGKSHLAAQCAPIKPARSSVAPLAVPINKQQSADKPTSINVNRTLVSGDANKPSAFRNNESLDSTNETPRMTIQRRYSLGVENTNNRFLSPNKNEGVNSNNQATAKTKNRASSVEPRNESIDCTNNLMQQQQQHREAASPSIVSSTASPSPPPANSGVNMRNENGTSHSDNNIRNNSSNGDNNATSSPTKSKIGSEMTCSKSPVSPDSSSITVESSGTSKNSISTDREMPTEVQTSSAKTSDSTANPDDSTIDDSATSDDKNKFVNKPEANEIAKQLTSEIVQKRLLAVFPSNEWANNPVAAEHLGNFLKSLNATMKSEGHTSVENMKSEESKSEKIDLKTVGNDDTKSDK